MKIEKPAVFISHKLKFDYLGRGKFDPHKAKWTDQIPSSDADVVSTPPANVLFRSFKTPQQLHYQACQACALETS